MILIASPSSAVWSYLKQQLLCGLHLAIPSNQSDYVSSFMCEPQGTTSPKTTTPTTKSWEENNPELLAELVKHKQTAFPWISCLNLFFFFFKKNPSTSLLSRTYLLHAVADLARCNGGKLISPLNFLFEPKICVKSFSSKFLLPPKICVNRNKLIFPLVCCFHLNFSSKLLILLF